VKSQLGTDSPVGSIVNVARKEHKNRPSFDGKINQRIKRVERRIAQGVRDSRRGARKAFKRSVKMKICCVNKRVVQTRLQI
jgi:hypothetical protein